MATEKLYFRDPHLSRFEATTARLARFDGRPSLVLDRTAFYPEGGGQLADRGTLEIAGARFVVVDVQVDEAEEIHHLLADSPPASVDAPIRGEIDFARRRDHMQQHTGQHMLSSALVETAGAETVSSRLGSEVSTIDVDLPALGEGAVASAEDLVNEVVLDDRPVRTLFPTPEELSRLPLRRPPKVSANVVGGVRIVEVEGLDLSPCGGTHCTRTGEVGMVRVLGLERYKGGTRVTFVAGSRALADYRAKDRVLRELASSFTCGSLDVPAAIARLRTEMKTRTEHFAHARGELVMLLAERTLGSTPVDASGTTRVVMVREGDDLGALRALAGALARRPDVVAMVASRDEGSGDWLVCIERGRNASFDAGRWLRARTAVHGGRGGGRSDRAEGRLPGALSWGTVATEP